MMDAEIKAEVKKVLYFLKLDIQSIEESIDNAEDLDMYLAMIQGRAEGRIEELRKKLNHCSGF